MRRDGGFTLIELLVVITILVVLLALLTPALDKAIYQAELTVCAANQHGIMTAVTGYAMGSRRRYPHREGPSKGDDNPFGWQMLQLSNGRLGTDAQPGSDDRILMSTIMNLDILVCPLTEYVDLTTSVEDTWVYGTYNLWWSFQYTGRRGMMKVGDRWSWSAQDENGNITQFTTSLLAGDRDLDWGTVIESQACHPDKGGVMSQVVVQDGPNPFFQESQGVALVPGGQITYSQWRGLNNPRGPLDNNFLYADGSVSRYTDVELGDARMVYVPHGKPSSQAVGTWRFGMQVPK